MSGDLGGDPALSNRLCFMAERIRTEHKACTTALRASVQHAIECGEALLEAKAALPHGGWLPWLKQNCDIAERTVQLYMRLAKNRTAIESEVRNAVADLGLNETVALLAMGSELRKLLEFAKRVQTTDPEKFLEIAAEMGFEVRQAPHPLAGLSEAEVLEWHIFALFLVKCHGWSPDDAMGHVYWIRRGGAFQHVAAWLSKPDCWWMRMPAGIAGDWETFAAQHHDRTLPDIDAELEAIQKQYEAAPKLKQKRPKIGGSIGAK